MMDKAKDLAGKASGGSSGNTGSSGGSSDSNPVHKGIDMATDKGKFIFHLIFQPRKNVVLTLRVAGLGDKYDSTVNKAADVSRYCDIGIEMPELLE